MKHFITSSEKRDIPFSLSVQTGKLQSLFATIEVRNHFCNESRSCFHYEKKSLSNPRSSFACRRWATSSRMHWPPWTNLPKLADQTMP